MEVGLVSVDSKIPNLALMKISAYHKKQGDKVQIYNPCPSLFDEPFNPDLIYSSKIFKFTPDYRFYPRNTEIIKGGSGYDIHSELPAEIENQFPDYSIFDCSYAMGFATRGCIRKCPFCIVPIKEGKIRAVADIYDFWNGQKEIMFLDNNITALPEHLEKIASQVIKEKVRVDFSQGLDIRLITPEIAQILARIPFKRFIRFAFDDIGLEQQVISGIKTLNQAGIKSYRLMFYVLIGFNSTPEEDLYRVELLRSLGASVFVMPYNKKDPYQRRFARYVNMKAVFHSVKWQEYTG